MCFAKWTGKGFVTHEGQEAKRRFKKFIGEVAAETGRTEEEVYEVYRGLLIKGKIQPFQ